MPLETELLDLFLFYQAGQNKVGPIFQIGLMIKKIQLGLDMAHFNYMLYALRHFKCLRNGN